MSFEPADLDVVNAYFEEMIGCVAGCGCWKPGWDSDERVAALAASTQASPHDGSPLFANQVLEALQRLFASLSASDMTEVCRCLEIHLPTPTDFQEFFGPSAARLAAALG